ncbi:MAG: AMP-binding protein [Vicinamibacterales bacterium]
MLPEPVTLPACLARAATRWPEAEAFVAPDGRRTWSALADDVRRTANALARAGVGRGDHVGLLLGNGLPWVTTFYACATLGAVTVPLSTRFRRDELGHCLRQADVSTLVFAGTFLTIDFAGLLAEIEPAIASTLPGTRLPRLRRAIVVGEGPRPAGAIRMGTLLTEADRHGEGADGVEASDLLLIQFTSGTTAFPKGVALTHRNMLMNADAAAGRIGVRTDDRYFSIRPFYHVAGTTLSLLVALTRGACLLTLPTFDVARALDVLADERCTLTSGNDTIFQMLMAHERFEASRFSLRGGWAAAGPEVMRQIASTMRVPYMCNAYGLSEASPNVVMSSWDDPLEWRTEGWMHPHPGIDVRVADPMGTPVPAGEVGEIQVRGWNVMRGYYGLPDETAQAFTADGFLKTGDLGVRRADGRLRMVGRAKEMFRVGGENVSPAEVEGVLLSHPDVQMAQVVGVPDARLGEVPAAYVVLRPAARATPDELIGWCRTRCANFKVPRHVRLVPSFDDIGMTGSAKVQRHKLRAHALCDLGLEPRADAPGGHRA